EDEPLVRQLGARVLRSKGYTVFEATNGEEGLRLAEGHRGKEIDLLLTDVIMPRMGGKELADHVKRLFPHVKVLFTSGYIDDVVVRHGVLEKEVAFIQKPF